MTIRRYAACLIVLLLPASSAVPAESKKPPKTYTTDGLDEYHRPDQAEPSSEVQPSSPEGQGPNASVRRAAHPPPPACLPAPAADRMAAGQARRVQLQEQLQGLRRARANAKDG